MQRVERSDLMVGARVDLTPQDENSVEFTMKLLRNFLSKVIPGGVSETRSSFGTGDPEPGLPTHAILRGENSYTRELSPEEIARGAHRDFVGGMWDEIGELQFHFLLSQGLLPEHVFLDVGCGSLRGGIHFIRYLEVERYYGLDINASLIEAGKMELVKAGCTDKLPHLLVNDKFEFSKFGVEVDYALALSVFTHLHLNHIGRCLAEIKKVLIPQGAFFATFFQAPHSLHLPDIQQQPGNVTTHCDADPFHYSLDEFERLAQLAGLTVELVEKWDHPRGQKMLCFRNTRAG